jgi:hypothetical protein
MDDLDERCIWLLIALAGALGVLAGDLVEFFYPTGRVLKLSLSFLAM